jgi:hypothetical protein
MRNNKQLYNVQVVSFKHIFIFVSMHYAYAER